ncbi:unnamed protein product [Rhizophagus irregularis]|nr:unnamed protein product [Rhizophagus irregularis]
MLYKTSEFQKYYLVCNLSKPVLRMPYRSKFDILWDELDGYFNKHNNTVVNELRTDATLSISIRRLRDRIITRLNQGPPLPSDIFIPSEDWIRSNFHHPTPLPRLCSTLGVLM